MHTQCARCGSPIAVAAGQMLVMPANVAHALQAEVPFKMLLVMILGEQQLC